MTNEMIHAAVSNAVAQFGYTARITGVSVSVYNAKGRLAGMVDGNGAVDRKYDGRKALMGALVRDAIVTALQGVK